jgi:methanogenic corrinoid protein MtbC1
MASKYGITDIRARLSNWRSGDKNDGIQQDGIANRSENILDNSNYGNNDNDLSLLLESLVIPTLVSGKMQAAADNGAELAGDSFDSKSVNLFGKPGDIAGIKTAGEAYAHDAQTSASKFSDEHIHEFARHSLEQDPHKMLALVEQYLDDGHSVESIYINLLAPVARYLGAEWEEDNCDFVDVTMGLWRIQEVLRDLTARIPPKARAFDGKRTALFSTMVGDQHSFGTLMIAECFQRSGWYVDALIDPSQSDLTHKVANTYFELLGLTISNSQSPETLSQLIKGLKSVSKNPGIIIMIGGREVNDNPQLVEQCGADASALDATQALKVASELVPINADAFEQLV